MINDLLFQPNPLAQLQHQTEMWQNYQDDVRPQSRIGKLDYIEVNQVLPGNICFRLSSKISV